MATTRSHDQFAQIDMKKESGMPVVQLFKNKRALSTSLFWITYFMSLLMVYGLSTWLPKLMMQAGYGLNSSLSFLNYSSWWYDYRNNYYW